MKKSMFIGLIIFVSWQFSWAGAVSWNQYFYAIRQIFPEAKQIALLINESLIASEKKPIARAAKAFNLKVKLFPIKDTRQLGSQLKLVDDESVLLVADDPLFMEKSSMIYILSKAKKKNISVVSCSKQYAEAGAFLTLLKDAQKKLHMVVNLKFQPQFAAKFTPELQQKLGISEIIK